MLRGKVGFFLGARGGERAFALAAGRADRLSFIEFPWAVVAALLRVYKCGLHGPFSVQTGVSLRAAVRSSDHVPGTCCDYPGESERGEAFPWVVGLGALSDGDPVAGDSVLEFAEEEVDVFGRLGGVRDLHLQFGGEHFKFLEEPGIGC